MLLQRGNVEGKWCWENRGEEKQGEHKSGQFPHFLNFWPFVRWQARLACSWSPLNWVRLVFPDITLAGSTCCLLAAAGWITLTLPHCASAGNPILQLYTYIWSIAAYQGWLKKQCNGNICRTHRVPTLLWLCSCSITPIKALKSTYNPRKIILQLKLLYFHDFVIVINILNIVGKRRTSATIMRQRRWQWCTQRRIQRQRQRRFGNSKYECFLRAEISALLKFRSLLVWGTTFDLRIAEISETH